jgi:hypothetical protein
MEWHDLLTDGYNRLPEFMENVLRGLSREDLNWQPRDDCNSIGWLVWHLTRQQDAQITALMGEEQLWIKDGWHSSFYNPNAVKFRIILMGLLSQGVPLIFAMHLNGFKFYRFERMRVRC